MKVYQSTADYTYSFPTVSLAYFLRYPNPYSKHVLSTDTISQYIDPTTQRLHTTRLHLKRSKVPAGILKFLPTGLSGPGGASQSYVLETSVVDVKEGWMETESRNMEWTGILSVIESAVYRDRSLAETNASGTSCKTTVTFVSQLGQTLRKRRKTLQSQSGASEPVEVEEEQPKQGFFAAWSTAGIQRTIELIGAKRSQRALTNSVEGMKVVLERLRNGGIKNVLEGMRIDRMDMLAIHGITEDANTSPSWKQVWKNGQKHQDEHDEHDD